MTSSIVKKVVQTTIVGASVMGMAGVAVSADEVKGNANAEVVSVGKQNTDKEQLKQKHAKERQELEEKLLAEQNARLNEIEDMYRRAMKPWQDKFESAYDAFVSKEKENEDVLKSAREQSVKVISDKQAELKAGVKGLNGETDAQRETRHEKIISELEDAEEAKLDALQEKLDAELKVLDDAYESASVALEGEMEMWEHPDVFLAEEGFYDYKEAQLDALAKKQAKERQALENKNQFVSNGSSNKSAKEFLGTKKEAMPESMATSKKTMQEALKMELPNTGSEQTPVWSALGMVLLSMLTLGFVSRKRRG